MGDYTLYLLVKAAAFILRLLPLKVLLWISRCIGSLIYYAIGKRRAVAYANLKCAFRGRYTHAQLNGIIKRIYQNLVLSFIELLKFPQLNESYIKKYVKTGDDTKIKRSLKEEGKGVIFLTAHFGNWELSSLTGSIKGYKLNVLARLQKMQKLNGYLNSIRRSKGANVIFKDDAKEEIMRALAGNEVVGILSDQDGGKRGEFVDFLGRKASTPKGAAQFSLRMGAPIFPIFIIRENGLYHSIIAEDDISVLPSDGVKKDIHEILQRFADVLAKYIEKYPDQWLWLHRRWKSTPTKYILVLSDGKAGHLKQSLALANMIKETRIEQGFSGGDTIIEVLDTGFKSNFMRAIFDSGIALNFGLHQLSFCFPKGVYTKINAAYGDYIVSCGASLAGVNLGFKKELGAKSAIIMRPNIYNVGDYDLAVIPVHDRIRPRRNIVFTKGSVTDLNRQTFFLYAGALKERVNITKGKTIGVLIGGDSKAYGLDAGIITAALDEVMRAADKLDAEVLLTTSRRTSKEAEAAVKRRLGTSARAKLVLIANEDNFKGAIEGILGLSDMLVVSGESIAMVTEAVSSGKKVVVFMPRKKSVFFTAKQESAVRNLEKKGLVAVSKVGGLAQAICAASGKNAPNDIIQEDAGNIRTGIRRIL